MKNMKGKIIALIMLIPLLLLFSTSSIISVTQLLVDMPITAINIQGEKNRIIELGDLLDESKQAQARESLTVNAVVTPSEAATDKDGNSKISYRAEKIEGNNLAKVVIKPTGEVIPLSVGAVAIHVEGDGKSDVVNMYFTSDYAVGDIGSDNLELNEGDSLDLNEYYGINAEWQSANSNIATINRYSGVLTAALRGNTTLSAVYEGLRIDDSTGEAALADLSLNVQVRVNMNDSLSLSFGGGNQKTVAIDGNEGHAIFALNGVEIDELEMRCDENPLGNYDFTSIGDDLVRCDFAFTRAIGATDMVVKITRKSDVTVLGLITATKYVEPENVAAFAQDNVMVALRSSIIYRYLTDLIVTGYGEDVSIRLASSNASVATFNATESQDGTFAVFYSALSEGETTLSAHVSTGDGMVINVEPITVSVVSVYEVLIIETEQLDIKLKSGSLNNVLAVGKYSLHGSGNLQDIQSYGTNMNFDFVLSGKLSDGSTAIRNDKLKWTSSDESIAYVTEGRLHFGSRSGEVLLKVENTQALPRYTGSAQIKLNIRQNGINIGDYRDLMAVSNSDLYESVLFGDIKLAPELETRIGETGFDYNSYVANCTTVMNTTADNTYYKNCGIASESVIRYALAINNNIYGNGYSIDGDNLTSLLPNRYNTRVFRGPLDTVRYSTNLGGDENMAIKAQDNAVFIVLKNNIIIDNIELKGCSDTSMQEGDSVDLTKLDYCGTVLEVVGDNVKVSYSRINNGRTVVRVFGAASTEQGEVADLRTHTTLSNCLLRYGREFLLKIGTNKQKKNPAKVNEVYLKGANYLPSEYPELYDDASPYLVKEDGGKYIPAQETDAYFYDNYVLNDVTVRDCVFMNAGLFCVGMESTFGGLVLHGYDYDETFNFSQKGWSGIAGTSYPSVLRLEGDVRFYDWKKVGDVNSSTLIEGGSSELAERIGLNIDMSALIDAYSQTAAGKNLTTTYIDGQKYVNGAIAYYGGGKNYSYVDVSGVSENFVGLSDYSVPINYFIASGRAHLLYYTAGAEPFRFMLYDSTSSLGVLAQDNAIKDNSAFSILYRK